MNFDYFDGNDLVAKLFGQEYQMLSDEKIDGMYYSIIKLHKDSTEYDLIWHEDIGNYIFSLQQDETSINDFEFYYIFLGGGEHDNYDSDCLQE